METYERWEDVPANLKTKTQLSEMGLKPKYEENPSAVVLRKYGSKRWEYNLYNVSNAIPKRKVTVKEPVPLSITEENIALALYTINKAAKRRRDGSESAYYSGSYGLAQLHKSEKEKLYELKDEVIQKAIASGIAKFVGVHKQIRKVRKKVYDEISNGDFNEDDEFGEGSDRYHWEDMVVTTYLGCYTIQNYRFHIILPERDVNNYTLEILDLGSWMSKASPRGKLKIKDAVATLEKYLES